MEIKLTEITTLTSLYEFEAWSGGLTVLEKIKEHNLVEQTEDYLSVALGDDAEISITELNDILWFDETLHDYLNDMLGREEF